MANWISHLIIVDKLYGMGLDLDERGFAVGNIAPDCNVENEDWTQFTPSREITHWMNGKSKLTADYDGFYGQCIKGKAFRSNEHKAFLWGYYAHLVTDVEMQKFVRDEKRVENSFSRIKQNEEMSRQIEGYPETLDTLTKLFGRNNVALDIVAHEIDYLRKTPNSRYNTIIKNTREFPDYMAHFPEGAIARKIGIMAKEDMSLKEPECFYFFSKDEYKGFIERTSGLIYRYMREKRDADC